MMDLCSYLLVNRICSNSNNTTGWGTFIYVLYSLQFQRTKLYKNGSLYKSLSRICNVSPLPFIVIEYYLTEL